MNEETPMQTAALRCLSGCAIAALTVSAGPAWGGAFQLNERSAKSQGMSFADSVSGAKDPSYSSFNPAALGKVEGFQASGNASGVFPISDGSTTNAVLNGQPVPLGALPSSVALDTNADRSGFVPASAFGYRINEDIAIGISFFAPFGLSTENPNNFIGAADGIQSNVLTVNIAPTVAWNVTENFSVGASLDLLFVDARLTSSAVALDGSNTSVSFSVGGLWEPIEGTQIGVAYHHHHKDIEVDSTARFTELAPFPLSTTAGTTFPSTVTASLPGTAQIGLTQRITDKLSASVEARYITWSVFEDIRTEVPALGVDVSDPQNYEDAFFVAVGAEYDVTETTAVRFGMAYDDSPTVDTTSLAEEDLGRTVRVPDADRLWFSVGASHRMDFFGFDTELDVAYSYLLALENPEVVVRSGPFAGSTVEYDGGAHIFSVGGTIRF
ncbi:MAG: outer membrane protein transport protein [Pseudomonadota bacterium]